MKILKIHFTKNSEGKIFSRAIMQYENSDFSHCAIEFRLSKLDEDVIYHSSIDSGVNFYSKTLFLEKNVIVHTCELEVTDEIYNNIMKQLIRNCGKKYALMQNLGILIVDILNKIGINIKNPWKYGYNCSELIYRHVILNIYTPEEEFDPNTITPKQIMKILNNNNKLTTI